MPLLIGTPACHGVVQVGAGGDMFLPLGDPASGVLGGVNVTAIEVRGACRETFNFTPMAVNSISFGSPRVPPMRALSTCGAWTT